MMFLESIFLSIIFFAIMTSFHWILFTILKVVVILLFCITALQVIETPQPINFVPIKGDSSLIMSGAFAISLIYVRYAYTGWNAATYLSSELIDPQRTLPGILITVTLIVTILYVALNFVFLYAAPVDLLQGQIEIGYVAAQAAFGDIGARCTRLILALVLVSTVSAMTIAGPRVLQVIGEDFNALRFLAKKNGDGIPTTAIYLQSTIAVIFILSSTFESILIFAGFTLALNSFATVLSVFVLRWKQTQLDRPYKTFLFPIPPIIYLTLTGWTLWFVLINRPIEVLFSFGIIGSGLIVYCLSRTRGPDQTQI